MATIEELQAEFDALKQELGRVRKLNVGHEAEVARLKGEAAEAVRALADHQVAAERAALLGELGLAADDPRSGEVVGMLGYLHGQVQAEEGQARPSLIEHARSLRDADHWLLRGIGPAKPPPAAPLLAPRPLPAERRVDARAPVALTPEGIARMTDAEWRAAKEGGLGLGQASLGDALAGRGPAAG